MENETNNVEQEVKDSTVSPANSAKKKDKKVPVLVAIIVVLVIAIIAVVIGGKSKKSDVENTNGEVSSSSVDSKETESNSSEYGDAKLSNVEIKGKYVSGDVTYKGLTKHFISGELCDIDEHKKEHSNVDVYVEDVFENMGGGITVEVKMMCLDCANAGVDSWDLDYCSENVTFEKENKLGNAELKNAQVAGSAVVGDVVYNGETKHFTSNELADIDNHSSEHKNVEVYIGDIFENIGGRITVEVMMFCYDCADAGADSFDLSSCYETVLFDIPEGLETTTEATSEETTTKETTTKETTTKETTTEAVTKSDSDIDPEFKEYVDGYEAFMDEYVEFMKKYQDSDNAISMLADYTKMMADYAEWTKKIDDLDEDDYTTAEWAYYLDAQNRINKKLLEVA